MQRILVVEDDFDIQELLQNFLQEAGYEVATANDGIEALSLFSGQRYDLIILDILLPKIDGYGVCELIRKQSDVPIIMLTALSGEEDQIRGLDLQVDDYITKPFSPVVLQKKIAVLTKYITEKQKETIYEDGNLCINFSQMTATLDKVPLELSPLEYRILQYFIVNKKHILKRDQFLEHLWDFSENFVGDTSLNTAISRLRKKIEASGHRYIKTIYGTGYMWIGD